MRPIPTAVGMGDTGPYFWVQGCAMDEATAKEISKRQHTAFTAESEFDFNSLRFYYHSVSWYAWLTVPANSGRTSPAVPCGGLKGGSYG
jgi:hypothetical protein